MTLLSLLFSSPLIFGLTLDESTVLRLASEQIPRKNSLRVDTAQAKAQAAQTQLPYQMYFAAEAAYAESKEDPLISFAPTMSPTQRFKLGVKKKSRSGLQYGVDLFGEQVSADGANIDKATQTGVALQAEMDLYSNWLGRLDRAKLNSAEQSEKRSLSLLNLKTHQFEYDVRKVYWKLVANQEAIAITQKLLKSAQTQRSDLRKRLDSGVANKGDVARSSALVEARKSSLLLLRYERAQTIKILEQLLPALAGKEISLGAVNKEQVTGKILQCVAAIQAEPRFVQKWSSLDQALTALESKNKADLEQVEEIGATQLSLQAMLQTSNVQAADGSFSESLGKDQKTGYGAALVFSVPLGSTDDKARQAQRALANTGYETEKTRYQVLMQSEHNQAKTSLELLLKGLQSLKRNNEFLKESTQDVEKRYRQARAGFNQLIVEQETRFNSLVSEIDLQLQIIHSLLEYFKVFDQTPCELNHAQKMARS